MVVRSDELARGEAARTRSDPAPTVPTRSGWRWSERRLALMGVLLFVILCVGAGAVAAGSPFGWVLVGAGAGGFSGAHSAARKA